MDCTIYNQTAQRKCYLIGRVICARLHQPKANGLHVVHVYPSIRDNT